MAFSDYKTLDQVQKEFNIIYQEADYLGTQPIALSQNFLTEIEFNRENIDIFASEAARTEAIIFPILREIYKPYHDYYSLWIQKSITYNEKLTGTPDYMIAKRSELGKTVLAKPFVIVVEAKRNDFEQGWAQCLAELVAAQKLNGESARPVHGIVTDGKLWEFGKLIETTFVKNIESYTIDHLSHLCDVLNFVFQATLGVTPITNGVAA
jgi:hypothetical protein